MVPSNFSKNLSKEKLVNFQISPAHSALKGRGVRFILSGCKRGKNNAPSVNDVCNTVSRRAAMIVFGHFQRLRVPVSQLNLECHRRIYVFLFKVKLTSVETGKFETWSSKHCALQIPSNTG